MSKIRINMLSKADSVEGQGVGSAYLELIKLLKEDASDVFDVTINSPKSADIIHVHTVNPTYLMRISNAKVPTVMYCHFLPETLEGSIKLPPVLFKIFKKYVVDFYTTADYVVVVNPIFIEPLTKLGVKKERIKYIPNFVSKENFYVQDQAKINDIRASLNIAIDAFVVLGVGQVQTRKGVHDFVEVAKRNPDIEFVWCGGFSFKGLTDGYKELKDLMDHPPENVRFLGIVPRSQMNDMFNMANVLFMPSYNELFPMAILEAANAHTPILLRNLDLYKDILFGNYVAGENNDDFSNHIRELKENANFYQEQKQKSQAISNFYSRENVLKIWKEFYTTLHNEKPIIVSSRPKRIKETRAYRKSNKQ